MRGARLVARAAVSLCLLLFAGEAVWAQPASYSDLRQEYRALFKEGRYEEALPFAREAMAKGRALFGEGHQNLAVPLSDLALILRRLGRYEEAEPLYKTALAIEEQALGPGNPNVATTLANLAAVLVSQGRYDEAEPLFDRALAIKESVWGPDHPDLVVTLNNLAVLYDAQGRNDEAEALYRRALAIEQGAIERGAGGSEAGDARSATTLGNLALTYEQQGRYAEAEALYKQALESGERTLGPDHPALATPLTNLANLYRVQDRHGEAGPLLERALAIQRRVLGPNHPDVAIVLNNMAHLHQLRGDTARALPLARQATAIFRQRAAGADPQRSSGATSEQRSARPLYLSHLGILGGALDAGGLVPSEAAAEGFEVGQLAATSEASQALARSAARIAAGEGDLAVVVRRRQDSAARWRSLDAKLIAAATKPPEERDLQVEQQLRAGLAELSAVIAKADTAIAEGFPEYAELANPQPVSLAASQALLGRDEALMVFVSTEELLYLWVLRRDQAFMHRLDLGARQLANAVTILRRSLDPTGLQEWQDIRPFDLALAHRLYGGIFRPAETLLAGARHVMIVPDGALQSLPFGVLVSEEPDNPGRDFARYRDVPWLAKRYAMTVLPSVASLRSLRRLAETAPAGQPFMGFGDPAFAGAGGAAPRPSGAGAVTERGATDSVTERGATDLEQLRSLPPLPDTADELRAIATSLGAGDGALYLRGRATETAVKTADLSDARVLVFATHAFMAGDFANLNEAALILTPPAEPTAEDDGVLTASEVAELRLNADWVVLSACNTAAPDGTPGAGGLSSLARAFFYAGSRALLVSHWPVVSTMAQRLTTGAFAIAARNPELGRSEALRRSMLALMNDAASPYHAHPMIWAPFVVVGEGAAAPR